MRKSILFCSLFLLWDAAKASTPLQAAPDLTSLEGENREEDDAQPNGGPFIVRLSDSTNQFALENPTLVVCGETLTVEPTNDGVADELANSAKNFVGSAVACTYGETPVILNGPSGETIFETVISITREVESPSLNIQINEEGIMGTLSSDGPDTTLFDYSGQAPADPTDVDVTVEPSPNGGPFIIRLWDNTNQFDLESPTLEVCGKTLTVELTDERPGSETPSNGDKFIGSALGCTSGETTVVLYSASGEAIFETAISITGDIESPSFNIQITDDGISGILSSDGASEGAARVAVQGMQATSAPDDSTQEISLANSLTDKISNIFWLALGLIIGGIIGWKADKNKKG